MHLAEGADMKDDSPVRLATAELEAAETDINNPDPVAYFRRVCKALSVVCEAYLQQHNFGITPPLPFPLHAAGKLHILLEEIAAGDSPMADALLRRDGARGRAMPDFFDVKYARMYWRGVDEGWVVDSAFIRTVADLYGEMDDTVRSWRREAKNDPLNWMDALPPGLSKEERTKYMDRLVAAMKERGKERIARKQQAAQGEI
jgi:hypothetical protein